MKFNQTMKKIIVTFLFIPLAFFTKAQYQTNINEIGTDYFVNPIFAGDYPDPSIIRDGDNFYIVYLSFEYYPGLLIWQSKDLINWTPVTITLPNSKDGLFDLTIRPLDPGVVIYKVVVDNGGYEGTYLKMNESPYNSIVINYSINNCNEKSKNTLVYWSFGSINGMFIPTA